VRYEPTDWITPRIRMQDVMCKCDNPDCSGKHLDPMERPRTVLMLGLAAALLHDYNFTITSCMRCEYHNMAVGGAEHSAHAHNCAIDIVSERWDDLALDAELQGVWSAIIVNPKKKMVHLDLHPSDRITRGHCDDAGCYHTVPFNRRHGSPLKKIVEWNLDEEDEPPPYVNAALQRGGTDGI
jgi:hypothetical protein